MHEIFKFCEVFEATEKDNLKKHDFLLHSFKPNYNSRNNTSWRHTITFVMKTLKTGKNVLFLGLLLKSTINW